MRRIAATTALLLGAGLFTAGGAAAQRGGVPGPDRSFMIAAAQGNHAEVALGRLALRKAVTQDVKDFAQVMIDDHSGANMELRQLAGEKGVALPGDMGPQHRAMHARLSRLSGRAFDTAYIQGMIVDHQQAVALFRREAAAGRDADVKEWASQKLPGLEHHLTMSRETAAQIGAGPRGRGRH